MSTSFAFLPRRAPSRSSLAVARRRHRAQWIVFDPNNYAQNVLTAARELQQINNQITSLQNQAQMLINQARNLANLPYSSLQQLAIVDPAHPAAARPGAAHRLRRSADRPGLLDHLCAGDEQPVQSTLIANAQARWQNSVAGLQDALRVQAGVVGNLDTNRTQMSALVTSSQGATGALQATQAGNQILALQAQQLADLTATVAAQGRAQSLECGPTRGSAGPGRASSCGGF